MSLLSRWFGNGIRSDSEVKSIELEELDQIVWKARYLSEAQRSQMVRWSRRFIKQKHWEGCNGFRITEQVKRVIALTAALLVIAYPDWTFPTTKSVLVYPQPYVAKTTRAETQNGLAGEFMRAGETRHRGPLILNWHDIQSSIGQYNDGRNLIIHEFAHQLDMINDPTADGLPPLPQGVDASRWHRDFRDEFDAAQSMVAEGYRIMMDDYGLTHPSEFFAVSSEFYFQGPVEFREFHPKVYELLREFYVIDLAELMS